MFDTEENLWVFFLLIDCCLLVNRDFARVVEGTKLSL